MGKGGTGKGREGVRREWEWQTMEAVRRGACDSRAWEGHVGEGGVASQGLRHGDCGRGALGSCKVEKPN